MRLSLEDHLELLTAQKPRGENIKNVDIWFVILLLKPFYINYYYKLNIKTQYCKQCDNSKLMTLKQLCSKFLFDIKIESILDKKFFYCNMSITFKYYNSFKKN